MDGRFVSHYGSLLTAKASQASARCRGQAHLSNWPPRKAADMDASGETWRFEVGHRQADQIYLVASYDGGGSCWTQMQRKVDGGWELVTHLAPGKCRFSYVICEGSTFLNNGTFGLKARRMKDDELAVVGASPVAQTA